MPAVLLLNGVRMNGIDDEGLLRPNKHKFMLRVAWLLIGLSLFTSLADFFSGQHIRDPAIEALLVHPTQEALGGTIGYCLATSSLPVAALLLGLIVWRKPHDRHAMLAVTVSFVTWGLSLWCAFLPTSESGQELLDKLKKPPAKATPASLPPYEYTGHPSVNPDLPEYVSDKHGFSAKFPEMPVVTTVGSEVHYAAPVEAQKAVYSVFVTTYSRPLHADSYLEAYLQGRMMLPGERSKLIRQNKVLFLNCRALDYEYWVQDATVTRYYKGVKFVSRSADLTYTVSVVCAEETQSAAYATYDHFIKSFRLTNDH